jgi:hypothetical protein
MKFSQRLITVLTALFCFTLSVSLFSFTFEKEEEDKPPYKLKLGPVFINPFFEITRLGYDGNIFLSRTVITSDFRASPGAGANLFLRLGKRGDLSFTARGDYQWFRRLSSLNHLNRTLSVNLSQSFNHFSVYFSDSYQNLRDRIGWEIDVLTRHTINEAEIGFGFREEKKTSFGARLWDKRIGYDSEMRIDDILLADILDRREYGGSVAVYRRILPKTMLFSELMVNENRFRHPESNLSGENYRFSFGAIFEKTALIEGEVTLGYEAMNFFSPEIKDFRGIIGSSFLSYHLGSKILLSMNYARRFSYSYLFNYYLLREYGGGLLYYPLHRLGLDLKGNYVTFSYPEEAGSGGEEKQNSVRFYSLGARLHFSESGTAELGIGYQHRFWYDGYEFSGYYLFNTVSLRF